MGSANELNFMPTGMLQLSGQNAYKNVLRSHNAYLQNIATFPLYNTPPEQMSKRNGSSAGYVFA